MVSREHHEIPACRHVEIGAQLQDVHDLLVGLTVELGNTYPYASKQVRFAERAREAVDKLRSALDGVSGYELPGDAWAPTIYFGSDREERAADMDRVLKLHRANNPACCTDWPEGSPS